MIRIAEHCGFCAGARRSIDIALAALREGEASGRPVVLYRELLHNAAVMESLRGRGALVVDAVADIPENALVVVRAHGEGKAFHDAMRAAGRDVRDGTCANVRKIHGIVRAGAEAGKAVVIIGKRGHPEVEGANGWCGGAATVAETEDDIAAMPPPAAAAILAVCQTTAGGETVERLLGSLRRRFPGKTVEFGNTLCPAPLRILEPSLRLAGECDVLFTIGGAESANTSELRARCAAVGAASCPPQLEDCRQFFAYLRENERSLGPDGRYGFTAGASTPPEEVRRCRDLLAFWLYAAETKRRLEAKMARVNESFAAGDGILREAGRHFAALNAGGKCLRGILANLGHRIAAGGEGGEHADPLSLAFEVFQTAILVHDDLIDRAALRRGRSTVHRRYREAYAPHAGDGDAARLAGETADALAVCVGDWGFFQTTDMLVEAYGAEPRFTELFRLFNAMVINTVQGEILDVALPFERRAGISEERGEALLAAIREIHRKKTAWYTTIGPLLCGMVLGGAGEEALRPVREFADSLGIAFQIQDDILGVFGDGAALGKDVGSDIAEYKQTLLYAYTEALSPALFGELRAYYGRSDLRAADLERVRDIFVRSGAYGETVAEMRRHFDAAREALERTAFLSEESRSLLGGLLVYIALRDT